MSGPKVGDRVYVEDGTESDYGVILAGPFLKEGHSQDRWWVVKLENPPRNRNTGGENPFVYQETNFLPEPEIN